MAKKTEFNIAVVKKYLFWACTPIGLIAAVATGWMAIGSIADNLDKERKQLESQKSAVASLLAGAATHPNQGTIDAIDEEREKLVQNVLTAWETMEKKQAEQNIWEGFATEAIQEIKRKNFLDTLESRTLASYRDYTRAEINKLLDKTNIRRVELRDGAGNALEQLDLTSGSSSGTTRTGRLQRSGVSEGRTTSSRTPAVSADGTVRLSGKVVWDSPTLDITMKNWQQLPQSYEVWLTQEDLWVYKALLWVVAESNKDAREASKPVGVGTTGSRASGADGDPLSLRDSVVKEIMDLSIGKTATTELENQSNRSIGGGSGGSMGEGSSEVGFGSSEGGTGGGGVTVEMLQQNAMARRYVDAEGSPLTDIDMTGQYRRMPVYLHFRVDQRRISDVLVNCANCPMPIDVLWVTINPDATQSFDYAPLGATMSGGSEDSSFSFSRSARSTRSSGDRRSTTGRSEAGAVDFGPHAVEIKIFGCINIFAPPDKSKIGGE